MTLRNDAAVGVCRGHGTHHMLANAAVHIRTASVSRGERLQASFVAGGRLRSAQPTMRSGQDRAQVVDLAGQKMPLGTAAASYYASLVRPKHALPAGGQFATHDARSELGPAFCLGQNRQPTRSTHGGPLGCETRRAPGVADVGRAPRRAHAASPAAPASLAGILPVQTRIMSPAGLQRTPCR